MDGSVFDLNSPFLPDVTNDQGLEGNSHLDSLYAEYYWQLSTSDYRFINKPLMTYTMTSRDGPLFGSSTLYVTEDTTTSLIMNSLMTLCFNELDAQYAKICDIPSSHQEAITWALMDDNDDSKSLGTNDYVPDKEWSITLSNPSELMSANGNKRGRSMGP